MSADARHHDPAVLLRTEHAVARVLAEADSEASAYPLLLDAIGESLGWDAGGVWTPAEDGGDSLRCIATWHTPEPFERISRTISLAYGEGLPGRVWASGEPAWIPDVSTDPNFPRAPMAIEAGLRAAFCFPIRGGSGLLGTVEFLAREPRDPDANLLATMASLGERIGHWVERWRAEDRLRESDARKSAILNAAFDCIITMDADGSVVEVNPAAEEAFRYTADEMVGRELAALIIPPELREQHRRGVERYVATGEATLVGHPVELPAMRSDGSEFMVEIAITRPELPGAPLFTGFLRDISERKRSELALRTLADQQAALRRVATIVAGEASEERVFAVVTEQVARLLGAQIANLVRFEPDDACVAVGAWSAGAARAMPVGTRGGHDGPTVAERILRSGRPERVDDVDVLPGATAERLRALGIRAAVGAPIKLGGRLWGAVVVAKTTPGPFPEDSEQRIADFAELVAIALANAQARQELAASRARIVQTGDEERRRLERNLHDGAQQRLVALSLTLRLCERKLAAVDRDALELVRRAQSELADALDELRELARGIHPAILTDRGLVPALEMLAARATLPVELNAHLDDQLPATVEAAAYYIVAEALTNSCKHSGGARVRVDVRQVDGDALVEVADDGVGGADRRGGSGLRGLGDRVDALGGRLELESPVGAGTLVRARLPVRPRV
jgi:PAS domain S-box-containing protein